MTLYVDTKQIAARFERHGITISERRVKTWIKHFHFPAEQPSHNSPYIAREELIEVWERLYYAYVGGYINKSQFADKMKTATTQAVTRAIGNQKKGGKGK